MRRVATSLIATLAALTVLGPAQAATANVLSEQGFVTVEYVAGAGEANALFAEGTFTQPLGRPFNIRFRDTGAVITPLSGCTAASPHEVTCSAAVFDYLFVRVVAGDLGDSVTLSPSSSATLFTEISGGDGNDLLTGGPGHESFSADAGSDVVTGGGNPRDSMTYLGRSDDVFVSLDGLANDGAAGEGDLIGAGIEIVSGGRGNDILIGGSGRDHLNGDEGNDTIRGRAGADELGGSEGHDVLVAGPGRDFVDAGGGNDRLLGGLGNDLLFARGGNDRIVGGTGGDVLEGEAGSDVLDGGLGLDSSDGGAGADLFLMKDGFRDRLIGGPGRDRARLDRRLDRFSQIERLI